MRHIFVPTRWSVCLQSFVTKLGIVVHHHEPESHAKKIGFYLQGQGHCVGLYNQNMTVSNISFISSKPESFATKLNLSVDHHKQRSFQ